MMVTYAIQSFVSLFWGFSFSRSFLVGNNVLYWGSAEPVVTNRELLVLVTVHRVGSTVVYVIGNLIFCLRVCKHHRFLIMKPTRCTNFSNLFLEWKSTCFGQFLCPSSGVFFHCTHSTGTHTRFADSLWAGAYAPARKLSANLYDIYHWCVHSKRLLVMDRGTVRNMLIFIPRINLRN
jgi:hypothetical protein